MIFFGCFLFVFFLIRLWLAGFGGLHPDEAYYWTWSKHLSLGYFDHPPMIAWLIRAGDFLVTHLVPQHARESVFFTQVGLRLVPYFVSCVLIPLVVGRTIEMMQKRPLGVLQMLALISAPAFLFGPQIVTPDTPFFLGWAFVLYFNLRILEGRGADAVPGDSTPLNVPLALLAGMAMAFTAYSKHSAILAAFLFIICGVGPFNALVAGFFALFLMIPHLAWYHSVGLPESAGVLFQFKNALGSEAAPISYRRLGDMFAGQFGLWTPVTFWLVFYLTLIDVRRFFLPRSQRRPTGTLFLWAATPVFFFALTALRRNAEANWPLVGIIAGLVLVISKTFDHRKTLWAVVFSHVLVCAVMLVALLKPLALAAALENSLPPLAHQLQKPSRAKEFTDWDRFHTLVFEATRSNDAPVLVQSYQTLSTLLFYDAAMPNERMGARLKIWPEASRKSDFNLHAGEYVPDPALKVYWLLTPPNVHIPDGCASSQTVYKNLTDDQPYVIYRCGF